MEIDNTHPNITRILPRVIDVANFPGRRMNRGRWMKNAMAKHAAAPSKHMANPTNLLNSFGSAFVPFARRNIRSSC